MIENNVKRILYSLFKSKEIDDSLHTEEEILEDICRKIGNGSEREKEKKIHDIILRNVEYEDSGRLIDHEKTGPILRQKGVCDGISKLADTLFKMNGIESELVYGNLCMGGEIQGPHAWNQIRISGKWYHVDITEDLALCEGRKPYRYDYFNLSDKEISRDHKIEQAKHKCTTSGQGYYETNNLYVRNVDEFRQLMIKEFKGPDKTLTVKLPKVDEPKEMEIRLNEYVLDYYMTICKKSFAVESLMNPDQMVYSVRIV